MRLAVLGLLLGCAHRPPAAPVPTTTELQAHCEAVVGEPRVLEPAPGVFVAVGYDLANVAVITTPEGNIVIDAGMSPGRALELRAALDAVAPGPVRALVYTHSHIDHVGGARVWVEEGTEVWATEAFSRRFFEQYGAFLPAELRRGRRQFGNDVSLAELPCSAIGRRVDIDAAMELGAVMPDHTFSGRARLEVGGRSLELVEAHGETEDQLFAVLEDAGVLFAGDNWYAAFPNLYTIRGTQPRPVGEWVASLDEMRAAAPQVLVPSHTPPVVGEAAVAQALTDTRDAIEWVRAAVGRAANSGVPIEVMAQELALPAHLAGQAALAPLYGQLDWSARAIFDSELGWFDGRTAELYPLHPADEARRMVALMGGDEAVVAEVDRALEAGEGRWALHLLGLLEQAAGEELPALDERVAQAAESVAATVTNTNGRGWLLQVAQERRGQASIPGRPVMDDALLAGLSLEQLFAITAGRVNPEKSARVHESVRIAFTDTEEVVWLTVRWGVAEVRWGEPLPGTPEPVATATTDSLTWKRVALGLDGALGAVRSGRLQIEGGLLDFASFFGRFDTWQTE